MSVLLPDTIHGAAVAYADLGWLGFPIYEPDPNHHTGCSCHRAECSSPAKHPRTMRGLKDATRDFDQIDRFFGGRRVMNVGIRTGRESGFLAVDGDGAVGLATMAAFEDRHGPLPESPVSLTARGKHWVFEYPEGLTITNSAGRVGPGVDVRGDDGYILVWPSWHVSGVQYRWAPGRSPFECGIAPAPGWLLDLVVKPEPEPFPEPRELPEVYGTRYVAKAVEAECEAVARTAEGGRNHQLNASAFSLARFVQAGRIDAATVVRALAHAGARAGLGRVEIERTLRSAFRARGAA